MVAPAEAPSLLLLRLSDCASERDAAACGAATDAAAAAHRLQPRCSRQLTDTDCDPVGAGHSAERWASKRGTAVNTGHARGQAAVRGSRVCSSAKKRAPVAPPCGDLGVIPGIGPAARLFRR
jgi:hypothetical protein